MSKRTFVIENATPRVTKAERRFTPIVLLACLGSLMLALVTGAVFAANVSLNGENDIEFGQGSQQIVACDGAVSVDPGAYFSSAERVWWLLVTVNEIDAVSCSGKTFTVTTWNTDGVANDEWVFTLDNAESDSGSSWMVAPGNTAWHYASNGSEYSVSLASTLDSQDLATITIETSD